MILDIYSIGPYATNVYVLKDTVAKQGVVVDAPPESYMRLAATLKGFKIHLFLTHGHWDHMCDAAKFQKKLQATVYANKEDDFWFTSKEQLLLAPPGLNWDPITPDRWLEDGQELEFGEIKLKVITIPGHTQGQIALYVLEKGCVFVGDTLFAEGVGRTDLPGGNFRNLVNSIRDKLYRLPGKTIVYPGHGPSTTIEHECAHNPFVPARES